jgi:integrase
MRELIAPTADSINRNQHEVIATGAAGFDQLVDDQARLAGSVRDVLSGRGSPRLELLLALFLTSRGISEGTPEAFKRFVHVAAGALHSKAVTPNARRLEGEPVEPPPLPVEPSLGASLLIPAGQGKPKALTLGPLIEAYIAAYPANDYKRKMVLALTLFRELVGAALPVQDLKRAHVADFLETVCKLPSDWADRSKKGETLEGLLADVDSEGIAKSTYEDNYRGTLRKFLKDMDAKYGDQGFPHLTASQDYTGTRDKGESKQRHLEEPELVRLFHGEEFAVIAADPAQSHRYWLPVIGLYTGARPREICQLNPQCDWGVVDGIYYFDFNENKLAAGKGVVKSIKTGERRLVAMHPELVRLGLPGYLGGLKAAGVDRLFPAYRLKGGNPYTAAGAEFSEFLRTVGLYDNESKGEHVTGMYTFRKTFATYGDEQGVNVTPFIGHREAGKTMADVHYITRPKGVPLQMAQLQRLTYPVSIPLRSGT